MKRHVGFAALALLLSASASAFADPAQPGATPAPTAIGPVTSTNQGNGVTAGYVGTVQIAPPLVRGPQLETFKQTFSVGAQALRALKRGDLTDAQIDALVDEINQWANGTYAWLHHDVSEYAAERFLFETSLPMSWDLPGDHKAGEADRRNNAINSLTGWLQNVDMLMRDPSIYPER